MKLPEKLLNAVAHFAGLPGVGAKTATRQALYLSNQEAEKLRQFGESIIELATLKKCPDCFSFSDGGLCSICASELRKSPKIICVVENFTDLMAIERSGEYQGLFHILGGVLNPLMGVGPDELAIDRLLERLPDLSTETIILAVNSSVEGDATCSYIKSEVHKILPQVNVERIGFGMPIGGSLEYLDPLTISKALEFRRIL